MQTATAASRILAGEKTAAAAKSRLARFTLFSRLQGLAAALGVTARVRLILFLLLVLPPAAALYALEIGLIGAPGRMLGLWLALALILLRPLSRLASRFISLGDIAALNDFCAALRRGEYHRRLSLPPEGADEHEVLRLKRDLNWLAHSVESRETWLRALLDEAHQRQCHFEDLSRTDALTGLFNRRHFDDVLPDLLDDAAARGSALALLFLDCDVFKGINDRFGHPAGDAVLAAMGRTLTDCTRDTLDLAFRLGGDEFAVVLAHLPESAARRVAERIRERFAASNEYGATASIGLACLDAERDQPPRLDALANRCDAALYRAKDAGGNRVVSTPRERPDPTAVAASLIDNEN